MAGRFPFDSNGPPGSNPLDNPNIRAALGWGPIDEAMYLQRQQELSRDFRLRQIFLQEQMEQQNRLEMLLQERMQQQQQQQQQQGVPATGKEPMEDLRREQLEQQTRLETLLQERMREEQAQADRRPDVMQEDPGVVGGSLPPQYSRLFLGDQLPMGDEHSTIGDCLRAQAEEELRRRQLLAHHDLQLDPSLPYSGLSAAQAESLLAESQVAASASFGAQQALNGHQPGMNPSVLRDLAADSLAGNAVRRSVYDRRQYAETALSPTTSRSRSNTNESKELETPAKRKYKKREKKTKRGEQPKGRPKACLKKPPPGSAGTTSGPSAQDLLDFAATSTTAQNGSSNNDYGPMDGVTYMDEGSPPRSTSSDPSLESPFRGTFADLLDAAQPDDEQSGTAVNALLGIRKNVEWSESEDDQEEEPKQKRWRRDLSSAVSIDLPNFHSSLPELPVEPEEEMPKPAKKRIGLLDDDPAPGINQNDPPENKAPKALKGGSKVAAKDPFADYPHPIDPWWPSVAKIKEERASTEGEEEDDDEKYVDVGDGKQFQANLGAIKIKLSRELQPGVLEKVPHCKIHRMRLKMRKNFTAAPELVQCFQVTELYVNDLMVCCSQCGTWRHAACGGHHKPYSVREAVETPFVAVCDRCHVEDGILEDFPLARKRLDRQRCEQIRRGLATSAAMRQASFSKHGGSYKWPLGSVSATHIGGHTRSVHSRHDKAEKQWTDMAKKMGSASTQRPKDRVKLRTKELERLLVSVEDAEGHTDRHNMMLFLLEDTLQDAPVGFEKPRLNLFDPEAEVGGLDVMDSENGGSVEPVVEDEIALAVPSQSEGFARVGVAPKATPCNKVVELSGRSNANEDQEMKGSPLSAVCCQKGCTSKPRFDSLFCSDACGVAALEGDLLRTLLYASDMHPSSLRS